MSRAEAAKQKTKEATDELLAATLEGEYGSTASVVSAIPAGTRTNLQLYMDTRLRIAVDMAAKASGKPLQEFAREALRAAVLKQCPPSSKKSARRA